MKQMKPGLFRCPGSFFMIAMDAGGDHIGPGMRAIQGAGNDVVDGQFSTLHPAILAGIAIPAENLVAGKLHLRPGTDDHFLQTNDGGNGVGGADSMDIPSSVQDEGCLLREN